MACQEEKHGGRRFTCKSNFFLRNFMNDLGAVDMGFSGNFFTLCNKRSGMANILERLDRVIVSWDWRIQFDKAGILHLNSGNSDHSPILFCSMIDHPSKPKPFRFLEVWTRNSSCRRVIQKTRNKLDLRSSRTTIVARISNTAIALIFGNKHCFGFCQMHVLEL